MIINDLPQPHELLPHRPPMLLLDEIQAYQPGESVTATTYVHPESLFFEGHFPDEPILPEVILVEMMFQTCGLFGRLESLRTTPFIDSPGGTCQPRFGRAIKIDTLSFGKAVLPGNRLQITAVFSHKLLNFSVFTVQVEINGRGAAANGTITMLSNP